MPCRRSIVSPRSSVAEYVIHRRTDADLVRQCGSILQRSSRLVDHRRLQADCRQTSRQRSAVTFSDLQ